MPLLDSSGTTHLKNRLADVLPGVHVYVRESRKEDATLLLLRTRYVPLLIRAGLLPPELELPAA